MIKNIGKRFFIKRIRKHLTVGYNNKAGCNYFGKKVIYTQSGGLPFKLRVIDFKRNYVGYGKILLVEKDLNRTAFIGLTFLDNGFFTNILLSNNYKVSENDGYFMHFSVKNKIGSVNFLYNIVTGTFIHHIEIQPGQGAAYCRAAGTSGFLISKDETNKFSFLKMKSGWLLKVSNWCLAIPGIMSNEMHIFQRLEKAGKSRNLGFRPHVRGVVKNPCDHPHGGGEGKGSPPSIHRTPYGKPAKSPTILTKLHYKKKKSFKIFKVK